LHEINVYELIVIWIVKIRFSVDFFLFFLCSFFSEDVEKLLCVLEANGLFYLKFFGVL